MPWHHGSRDPAAVCCLRSLQHPGLTTCSWVSAALLRCGLTRPLWRVAESLHHVSADHDCLLHVGFPALCACLLVA